MYKSKNTWAKLYTLCCLITRLHSLRIQPHFIRSRYYVRNANKDVCDSRTEIPYRWRKSVLNADRSAHWLTEQFCIISSTIFQRCDVQIFIQSFLGNFSTLHSICLSNVQCCYISKTSASVSSGFPNTRKLMKARCVGRVLLLFSSVWKPRWNTKRESLKLRLQ